MTRTKDMKYLEGLIRKLIRAFILVNVIQLIPVIRSMAVAMASVTNEISKGSSSYDSEEMSVPRSPLINGLKVIETKMTVDPRNNGSTSIECSYEGNPTPQIIWLKNSKDIPETHKIKSDLDKGKSTLIFPENERLIDEKRTNYTCVAANFLGRDVKSIFLKPPKSIDDDLPLTTTKYQRDNNRWWR